MLAGAAVVKSVLDQYNMMGPVSDRFPKCTRCNGSGRVSCLCNRWSDGDRGCGACAGSGWMVCSSCRGGGTGHLPPFQISVRPPKRPY
nr:protein SSUH2 homolog [Tanacetum cinerariifolium]GEY96449.1 protein SSUH2 homolog [Tanacetum cinerariifolium]